MLMLAPMVSFNAGEITAWTAAVAGVMALLNQGYGALKKRRQEREEIDEALDRAPEVRHQLELGNVGEAVKHLNVIIESQARHIKAADVREAERDREIQRLKEQNQALEAEAQGWETRYYELVRKFEDNRQEADRQIAKVQREMEEMKRTFARTLARLRDDKTWDEEPGEMT